MIGRRTRAKITEKKEIWSREECCRRKDERQRRDNAGQGEGFEDKGW